MKTKTILKTSQTLLISLAIFGAAFTNNSVTAQNPHIGISVKNICSGGGLGSVLAPQFYLKNKAHEVAIGLNIQKKHMNVTGIRVSYNFVLNPGDATEIFLFYDIATFDKAYLSNRTVKTESFMRPENSAYFQTARLNSVEQHAGFGVKFLKAGPVSFFGAIGAGVYCTMGAYQTNLFRGRDHCDASIMLSLGLNFKIIPLN